MKVQVVTADVKFPHVPFTGVVVVGVGEHQEDVDRLIERDKALHAEMKDRTPAMVPDVLGYDVREYELEASAG